MAKAIHQQSRRRGEAFVEVNCGALPEGVVESELFGHEREHLLAHKQPERDALSSQMRDTLSRRSRISRRYAGKIVARHTGWSI